MRLLLLVARRSYRARAFLAAARSLGIDVTVASDHRASLGGLTGDSTLNVRLDDLARSLPKVLALARRTPLHGVVSAEDDGVLLAAAVARELDLRHASPDAVRTVGDKAAFRERVRGAPWSVPGFRVVTPEESAEEVVDDVRFPCVVKPVSLSASRGVIRVDAPAELGPVLARVRRIVASARSTGDGSLLIEDFMPGAEVALEGLLTDGALTPLALMDKPEPMDGPYFEETLLITPSRMAPERQASVVAVVQAAARTAGLEQGPVHAEVRVDGDRVRLLELAPRSIGGRCSRIVRFAGGRTLEEVLLEWAMGGAPVTTLEEGAAGVMMLPIPGVGVLGSVAGTDQARLVPGVEDLEIAIPRGHPVVPLPEGHRYLGFLFARGASPARVERSLRRGHACLDVVLDPAPTTGIA